MRTPREIEAAMKSRCYTRMQAQELMDARNRFVESLASRGRVESSDLKQLDRLGRFRVANELWHLCPCEVRDELRQDAHHHVRAAAQLNSARSV